MAAIYHTQLLPISFSATSAAAGYAATNVGLNSIARPWRSTGTTANDVVQSFAAAGPVAAILVQDVNFASCAVLKSSDGVTFTSVGTLSTFADKWTGRRRGLIVINDANVKAVKLSISSGTPTDGLGYWRIGAAPIYATEVQLPRLPDYKATVRALFPKSSVELPNKIMAVAATGQDALILGLPFDRRFDEDVLELVRRARVGPMALSLVPNNYPELVLPVKYVKDDLEESFDVVDRTTVNVEVREVV